MVYRNITYNCGKGINLFRIAARGYGEKCLILHNIFQEDISKGNGKRTERADETE